LGNSHADRASCRYRLVIHGADAGEFAIAELRELLQRDLHGAALVRVGPRLAVRGVRAEGASIQPFGCYPLSRFCGALGSACGARKVAYSLPNPEQEKRDGKKCDGCSDAEPHPNL